MGQTPLKITIVQYAGDFREASLRLAEGGGETYRAQRYTVEFVEQMAQRFASVTTITGFTQEPYDMTLASGAKAIGAGFRDRWDSAKVTKLLAATNPDRIILRVPNIVLLRWIVKSRIATLALLADSLPPTGWKGKLKRFLTVRYLNDPTIEVVANHGSAAAEHLVDAGVKATKVIAWDYPAINTPYDRDAKARGDGRRLIFVGAIAEAKGVGDLLQSIALLKSSGKPVTLDLYGAGDIDKFSHLARTMNVGAQVSFKGMATNETIIALMAEADLVVVPSRHEYSEGLPLTIYEALCSRTPLIVSDHPMFTRLAGGEEGCLVFPAANPFALAGTIERVLSSPELYSRLSEKSLSAWERIQISSKWGDVINDWLTCSHSAFNESGRS